MKIYRSMRDPNVLHDADRMTWFPRETTHPEYAEFLRLLETGEATLEPFQEPSVSTKRQQAYRAARIGGLELVEALWENLVEGRPEKMNQLQAARLEIKTRFPKA